jgi:hypothetical protein
MEKVQDWMEITLLRTLHWFPLEFFGFPSSSSLSRYSKLCFARSPYMVQRFEFPLVEHLLRSPRSHTYRSLDFCWTHCENSRIGGGRLAPVWPVLPTGLTVGGCQTLSPVFFVFSTHIYVEIILVHLYQHLSVPVTEINSWGHWLGAGRHRSDRCPSPVWPVENRTDPIVSTCRFQF